MSKILFILKRRQDFNPEKHSKIGLTTGLYNSANFMNLMLKEKGIDSNLEVVIDNNDIDREVTKYRPDIVVIEALWVVPQKFNILSRLHPKVKWIIRIHSDTPFMAQEGMSFDWIFDYIKFSNVFVAPNSERMLNDLNSMFSAMNIPKEKLIYLPNYYPTKFKSPKEYSEDKDTLDISCFGAIRPLKNQMIQAIAAVDFCRRRDKNLRFHINSERYESNGMPVFHNINHLFQHLPDKYSLHLHHWTSHEEFLETCGMMDLGLQVSYSETFNIVAADHVSQGVPILGSDQIPWIGDNMPDPNDSEEIMKAMNSIISNRYKDCVIYLQNSLNFYSEDSQVHWLDYLEK